MRRFGSTWIFDRADCHANTSFHVGLEPILTEVQPTASFRSTIGVCTSRGFSNPRLSGEDNLLASRLRINGLREPESGQVNFTPDFRPTQNVRFWLCVTAH
jgi:hypothetical protein